MLGAKKLLRSMQPGAATWLDWDEYAEEDLQGQGEGHLSGIFHDDAKKLLNFRDQQPGEKEGTYRSNITREIKKSDNVFLFDIMLKRKNFLISVYNQLNSSAFNMIQPTGQADNDYYTAVMNKLKEKSDVFDIVDSFYRKAWYNFEKRGKTPKTEIVIRKKLAILAGLIFDKDNVTNKDQKEFDDSNETNNIDIDTGLPLNGITIPAAAAGPSTPKTDDPAASSGPPALDPAASGGPASNPAAAAGTPAPNPADTAAGASPPAPNPADTATGASPPAPNPADTATGASPPVPDPTASGAPTPDPTASGPSAPDPAASGPSAPNPAASGPLPPNPAASSTPAPDSTGAPVVDPPDPTTASTSTENPPGSTDGAAAGPATESASAPGSSATAAVPYPFTVDLDPSRAEAQMLVNTDFPLDKIGDIQNYKDLVTNLFTVSKTLENCESWFLSILQDYDTVTTSFTQMSNSENFKNFTKDIKTVLDTRYASFEEALKAWKVDTDSFNALKSEIERLKPDPANTDAQSVRRLKHLIYIELFYQTEIEKKQKVINIIQNFKKIMLSHMEKIVENVMLKIQSFPVDSPPVLNESNFDTKDDVIDLYAKLDSSFKLFENVGSIVQFSEQLFQEIKNHCSETKVLSEIINDFSAAFTFKLQYEQEENIKTQINFYGTLAKLFENWLQMQITIFKDMESQFESVKTDWSKLKTLTFFTSKVMEKKKAYENFHGMEIFAFFKMYTAAIMSFPDEKTLYEILIDPIQIILSKYNMSFAFITVYLLNLKFIVQMQSKHRKDFEVIHFFLENIAQEKEKKTDDSPFDKTDWNNVFTQYLLKSLFHDNFLSIPMSIVQKVFPENSMIVESFLECIQKQMKVEDLSDEGIRNNIERMVETPTNICTEDKIKAFKNQIIDMVLAKKKQSKQNAIQTELQKELDANSDLETICNNFCVNLSLLFALDPKAVDPEIAKAPCEAARKWINEKNGASIDMANFDDLVRLTNFLMQGCELAQQNSLVQADDTPNLIEELAWIKNMIEFAFDQSLLKSKCDFFILRTLQYVSNQKSTFDDFDDNYLLAYLKLLYLVLHEKKIIPLTTEDPPLFGNETLAQEYLENQLNYDDLKRLRGNYAADKWALEVFPPVTTIMVTEADLANYIASKVPAASNVSEEIGKIQAAVQACVAFFDAKSKEGKAKFDDADSNIPQIFVDQLQLKGQTTDSAILLYIQKCFESLHASEDFPNGAAESAKKDWVKSQFTLAYEECSKIELSDAENEKGAAFWDWFALCYNLKGLSMYDACAPELWDWVFETDLPRVLMPEVTVNADEVAQNFQRCVSSVEYAARKDDYNGKIRDCVDNTLLYHNLDREVTVSVNGEDQQRTIQVFLQNIHDHINDIYCFDRNSLEMNYAERFSSSLEILYNFFQYSATENFETKLPFWKAALDEINTNFIVECNDDMKRCIDNMKQKLTTVDDLQSFSMFILVLYKNILVEESLFLFYSQIKGEDDENKIQWEALFSGNLESYLKQFKGCFPEKFVCFHEKFQVLFDASDKLQALQSISAKSTGQFKELLEGCNSYSLYIFPCLIYLLETDFDQSIENVKKAILDKSSDDVVQYLLNNGNERKTLEELFQGFDLKESLEIDSFILLLSSLEFYEYVKDNLDIKKQKPNYSDANVIVFLDWTMDIEKIEGLHDTFTFTVSGTEEKHQKKDNVCSEDLLNRHDVLLSFFAFVKAYLAFLKLNWMDDDTRKKLCANVINAIQETQIKIQQCQTLERVEQAWLYLWITYCLFAIDNSEFLYDLFVEMFGKKSVPNIFSQRVTDVSSIDLSTDSGLSAMISDHQTKLQTLESNKMTFSDEFINKTHSLLKNCQFVYNFEEQRKNLENQETQLCNVINFFTFVQKHQTNDDKTVEDDIKIFFDSFLNQMTEYIRQHDAYVQTHQELNDELKNVVEEIVLEAGLVSSLLEKTSLNICKTVRYCEVVTDLKNKIKNVLIEDGELPEIELHKITDPSDMSLNSIIMNIFFIYNFKFKQISENDEELKIVEPISSCLNQISMLYYASLKYKNVFAADPSEAFPEKMKWPFQVFLLTGIADLLDATVDKNSFWEFHMDDDTKNALGNKSFDELYREGLKEHAQNKLRFVLDPKFDSNTALLKNSSSLLQELANDSKTASECTASLQTLSEALGKEYNNFVGYRQISERMSAVNGLVQEARAGVSKLDEKVKQQTTFANDLQAQLNEARRQAAAAVKPAAPAAAASPAGGSSPADAAKIAELERKLEESNEKVKDLDGKYQQSQKQLQTEKDALQAANKTIEDTKKVLQSTKDDLAAANSTNSDGAGEIARLKAKLITANEKTAQEEKSKLEAEKRENDVRGDLATANSEIAQLRGEVARLKATPSGSAGSGSAASANATLIGKLTTEKAALESKLTEETRLKNVAEKERDDAKKEVLDKNQKIKDLEGEKASAEAKVTSLTKEKDSLAAEKRTAEDAKQAAEDAKTAAEDAKTKAEDAATQAKADLSTEQAKSILLQTHVTALENWGEQIQGVAKKQYPVYQKITEYYGGLYKFHPPAAKQQLPPKPA